MIFSQELRHNVDENAVFTIYRVKKFEGFCLQPGEIERHGLVMHFEWYRFRWHLTVEVQTPPEGYTYRRLMYKHKNISRHNYCRTEPMRATFLTGKQYHQIQTRFWLPRILLLLWTPENFRAIYEVQKGPVSDPVKE